MGSETSPKKCGPGGRLRHNIQRAYEAPGKRCRAPSANGLSSPKAILSPKKCKTAHRLGGTEALADRTLQEVDRIEDRQEHAGKGDLGSVSIQRGGGMPGGPVRCAPGSGRRNRDLHQVSGTGAGHRFRRIWRDGSPRKAVDGAPHAGCGAWFG